jgi:hypothetical protein|tara:strand:+ start:353 stop:526 length:174 start_codon:yes stop_codon:yes gene_type:complete
MIITLPIDQAKELANDLNKESMPNRSYMVKVVGTTNTAQIIIKNDKGRELGYLGDKD